MNPWRGNLVPANAVQEVVGVRIPSHASVSLSYRFAKSQVTKIVPKTESGRGAHASRPLLFLPSPAQCLCGCLCFGSVGVANACAGTVLTKRPCCTPFSAMSLLANSSTTADLPCTMSTSRQES